MDEEKTRSYARKGGLASARTRKTSNRGFASMDKEKLKVISSLGGKASRNAKSQHPDGDQNDEGGEGASERDLTSLESQDERESTKETQESLQYSETDEDEDEGTGDGNLGRSTRGNVFGK